ncbi:MAG: aminopeptidase P family protein [Eubacteriaceae bacterium]|nr:aminopeptidase P family protein [Eubacteriaceae bacterium]
MKSEYFIKNRKKFIDLMNNDSIAVIHSNTLYTSSADMNYDFEVDREFYYLTGIEKPDFIYMAEKNSDYVKETLFAYRKDEFEEKWTGYRLTSDELSEISGLTDVASIDKFYNSFAQVMAKRPYKKVYINTKILSSWKNYKTPYEYLSESISRKYPHIKIKNTSEITVPLRLTKEEYEIDLIKKAAAVTNCGLLRMMSSAYEGINEKELEAEFEYEVIKAGMKNSFAPIVAGGKNGLVLHYNENNNIISSGSLVLIDAGASYKNYCADVSRTFPVSGKFDIMQRKVYDIVLAANEAVIGAIKEGVTFDQLEDTAKSILSGGLIELGIMKTQDELGKYYYHTIGHSLGLDAHDPCDKSLPIKSGMVLTVEPGLYIKELNIGIRIEDNVLVTDTSCDILTSDIIKKAEDIEKYMHKGKKD